MSEPAPDILTTPIGEIKENMLIADSFSLPDLSDDDSGFSDEEDIAGRATKAAARTTAGWVKTTMLAPPDLISGAAAVPAAQVAKAPRCR